MSINKTIYDEKKYPYVGSLCLTIPHLNPNIYKGGFFKKKILMIGEEVKKKRGGR